MKSPSAILTLLALTSTTLAGVVVMPSGIVNNITSSTTLDELFARNAAEFTCTKGTDTPSPDMHLDKYGCKGITPQICAEHASCKEVTVTDSAGKKCKRYGMQLACGCTGNKGTKCENLDMPNDWKCPAVNAIANPLNG
ncbi:uncharacterized protein AB675_4516 [Cyphellophora attinorum]|uniref:EGF-like domain-containing protein n=1 Tax=Cyphellophora attinorum TaxID=1664694 RepID=A0A0N1HSF5_9EURO|nr:uncharacterized protein AB675_4516 [Phialophora attinorum]KPI39087.1 hypothetical protein AB675_4516 [Phialophora attinorum]